MACVFAPPAFAGSAADRLLDALAGAHAGLLLAAVALHVAGQVCRGLAWRGVLSDEEIWQATAYVLSISQQAK